MRRALPGQSVAVDVRRVRGTVLVREAETTLPAPLAHFPEPGMQGATETGSGLGGRPLLAWRL